MSFTDSIVTAGLTTALGLFAFVLGQFALKLIVEPIQEQARIVGEVTHALTYYRNVSSETSSFGPEGIEEARRTYRDLAARLRMNIRVLRRWYRVFARPPFVLPAENVRKAAAALIILSSTVRKDAAAEDVMSNRAVVRESLNIE
jgi:hypothetical protein